MAKKAISIMVVMTLGLLVFLAQAGAQSTQTTQSTDKTMQPKKSADKQKTDKTITGKQTMGVNSADQSFMKKAAEGGMAEVALGELAAKQASSEEVKQFGQRMVDDHSKANRELMDLASQKGVTLPSEPNSQQKAMKAKMEKMTGANFDRDYVHDMVKDHDKDVAEFEKQSRTAHDPDLKAWAAKTLPTLQEHQKMIHEIANKMGAGKTNAATKKKDTKTTSNPPQQ